MVRINRLAFAYYVGVVVDAFAALALLTPAGSPLRAAAYPGVDATQVDFADGTRTAFGLMLGWTLLMAWGARRPVERRAVLLLTAVPVVSGLMLGELLDIVGRHASLTGSVPTLVLQAVLLALFIAGYVAAGREDRALRADDVRPGAAT